jgi:hypothetical protein
MSPFENISVDFFGDPLVGQIEEDGGDRRWGDRLASTTAFLQKMPLALLRVPQLGNLLVVAIGCKEYKNIYLEQR